MPLKKLTVPFVCEKSADGAEEGVFEGYASVFGVLDSDNDIVEPGAFAYTLKEGAASDGVQLLAQHNDTMLPIGKSLALSEDAHGLKIKGYISPTAMGNDCRQLVKDGVIADMSIGYSVIEAAEDERGVRHLKQVELYEISLVNRPANPEARITAYKQQGGHTNMPNVADLTVEQLQEMLTTAAQTAVSEMMKQAGDTPSAGDEPPKSDEPPAEDETGKSGTAPATETKAAKQPKAATPMERKYADVFLPRPAPTSNAKPLPPGIGWARYIKCLARASGDPERAADIAHKSYEDARLTREIKALSATSPTDGGFLVPDTLASEVIPLLYAKAIVTALGATVVPMDNGSLTIPRMASGATASYIGELRAIKGSQPKFENMKLSAKKLTCKVLISNDLIRSNAFSADQIVLNDAVQAMALRMDEVALSGKGTEFEPLGLFNVKGIPTVTLNGAPDEKTSGKMLGQLMRKNADISKLGWAMNPIAWEAFYNVANAMGLYIYRAQMDEQKINGHAFATTTLIPTASDGKTKIVLGNWSEFLVGEQLKMQAETFKEGSVTDVDGNTVSAIDNDLTILRLISLHDFGLRHAESFVIGEGLSVT